MVKITSIVAFLAVVTASASATAIPTTSHLLRRVSTNRAPNPIGPFCQGIMVGNMLYTSGANPLDPVTGKVVPGGMEAQVKRSLQNMRAVIESAGSNMGKVVKTTVFMTSLDEYDTYNRVYGDFFGKHTPARSTVMVSRLPKGVMFEIEAVVRL